MLRAYTSATASATSCPIATNDCSCPEAAVAASLVGGVSVAVSVPITSIITAIVSSIITYWCCIKKASPIPADYETPMAATVDVQPNVAYGHVGSDKLASTAVYDNVIGTDL